MKIIISLCLVLTFPLYSDEVFLSDKEIDEFSIYMGYLLGRDFCKNNDTLPYNFDKVVEGLQAAMAGDKIIDQDKLYPTIQRVQKRIVERRAENNRLEAENFLRNIISNTAGLIEVAKNKLYYKVVKQGKGNHIDAEPYMHFVVSEFKEGTLHEIFSSKNYGNDPLRIEVEEMIPGFISGVKGMLQGERRVLYIHPDLAFGMGKHDIAPNRSIVIDVEAIEVPDKK